MSAYKDRIRDIAALKQEIIALKERDQSLGFIADELAYWIRDNLEDHKNGGTTQTNDSHIMAPPYWPTVGQLKNWIKVLRNDHE